MIYSIALPLLDKSKATIITALLFLMAGGSSAQSATEPKLPNHDLDIPIRIQADSTYRPKINDIIFKKLINREFSKVLNPTSNSSIGNFAAVDLKEASVSAAATLNLAQSLVVIKGTGEATDGLMPLFTNSKLNTGLELSLQYDFFSHRNTLEFDAASYRAYLEKIHGLNKKLALDLIKVTDGYNTHALQLEEIRLGIRNKALQKVINSTDSIINKLKATASIRALEELKLDSIKLEYIKTQQDQIENKYQQDNQAGPSSQQLELISSRNLIINKIDEEIIIGGAKIKWFTIGYSLKNSSFRLLYPNKSNEDQITKRTFMGHALNLQYSVYNYSQAPNQSYFYTIGVAPSIVDNLQGLSKTEINENTTYNLSSPFRYGSEKYNAYLGDYKSDRLALRIFADLYYFFLKSNRFAIHIFPEHVIQQEKLPTTNIGLGVLFAFQNQEKEKTIVNTELYVNAINSFNVGSPEDKLTKRSTAGIRFTFPITFR